MEMRRVAFQMAERRIKFGFYGPAVTLVLVILAALFGLGCGGQRDSAPDERAVRALLDDEARLAVAGNIDSLLLLYVQDDKNARLSVTKSVSAMITGWDAIRRHQENLLKSEWMNWEEKRFKKENVWVKVNGDNAWAVCDNVWQWREGGQRKRFQNIQITICEKHEGRWRIAFQAFVRDPEHMDVVDIP
ncbi:MAG: nuclear transport factor 2 family protein [bacterium]